jgi:hypothetical protein
MERLFINNSQEFIDCPEEFANLIEKYMGIDAREYFETITIENKLSKDSLSNIIQDFEATLEELEIIRDGTDD